MLSSSPYEMRRNVRIRSVLKLTVTERSSMEHHVPPRRSFRDLGAQKISGGKEFGHRQRILRCPYTLHTSREIDGGERERRIPASGSEADRPPSRLNLGDATDDEVADRGRWGVRGGGGRGYGKEAVDTADSSGLARDETRGFFVMALRTSVKLCEKTSVATFFIISFSVSVASRNGPARGRGGWIAICGLSVSAMAAEKSRFTH